VLTADWSSASLPEAGRSIRRFDHTSLGATEASLTATIIPDPVGQTHSPMNQRTLLVAFLILLALAAVLLLRSQATDDSPGPRATPDSVQDEASSEPEALAETLPDQQPDFVEEGEDRALVDPAELRPIRIRLVMEDEDRPVPGADVSVLPLDEATEALASRAQGLPRQIVDRAERYKTGDDGTLLLDLPRQRFVIAARAEGTVPGAEILPLEAEDEFEIRLVEECVLTGRVLFEDGSPAAGATLTGRKNVHLERTMRGRTLDGRRLVGMFFESGAKSGADGTYELRGLAQGLNIVEASLPGYSRATAPMIQVPWWPEHDFVLYARASLSGFVRECDGEDPVEGVLVEAFLPSDTNPDIIQAAYSNGDGSFQMDAVRGGLPQIHLRTYKEGYATEVVAIENLLAGEARSVGLKLEPASPLTGLVRYESGSPVPGAALLVTEQLTGKDILDLRTGEDGRFECLNLAPDRPYRFGAGNTYGTERVVLEDIVLPREPLEITLPSHGIVAGRITAPGDPALSGRVRLGLRLDTEVEYRQMWAEIDPRDGSYRFEDVAPGGHVLDAVVDGYAPARLEPVKIDPPRTDDFSFDLTVERGVNLTGRVTDFESGEPIVGAQLRLIAQNLLDGYLWEAVLRETSTDGAGLYRLEQVPRGARSAIAVDHGSHARLVEEIEIARDALDTRLDIALPPGATLRSWIEDAKGVPLKDATGCLRSAGKEIRWPTQSLGGVLTFDRLEPGSVILNIESRGTSASYGRVWFRREIDLRSGESREEAFSWNSGGRIHGRIQCPQHRGKPRSFELLVFEPGDGLGESRGTFAIAGSEFQVFGIPAGSYTVRIKSSDAGPRFTAHRDIEIEEGQDLAVDFTLGDAQIHGSVTGMRGNPLAGVTMSVREQAALRSSQSGESDVDGLFSVQGLTAGTYECLATKGGFGRQERTVELSESNSTSELNLQLEPEALLRLTVESRSGAALEPEVLSCSRLDSKLLDPTLPRTGLDSEGRFTFLEGRTGDYRVDARAPGHFPADLVVHLTSGETRDVAAVLRRLGNLSLRVEDVQGTPLPGMPVLIRDQETGALVSDWIAQGLIQSLTPAPITGPDGELLLLNLPEGKFTLEVPGTVRVVTIPPGATTDKLVLTYL